MYLLSRLWRKFMGWLHPEVAVDAPRLESLKTIEFDPPAPVTVPVVDPQEKPVKPSKAAAPSRSRTQVMPDAKTFSAFLDELDGQFEAFKLPPASFSNLGRREIKTLKRIGVLVPPREREDQTYAEGFYNEPTNRVVPKKCARPFAFCVSMVHLKYQREGWAKKREADPKIAPVFIYGLRLAKLPANVRHAPGTPYQMGFAYPMGKSEKSERLDTQLWWVWSYAVIQDSGEVVIPEFVRNEDVTIRHFKGRRNAGAVSCYSRKKWVKPAFLKADGGRDVEEEIKTEIAMSIRTWNARADSWSVGVRKSDDRVCFMVDPKHTSAYFADRDRTMDVNGKKKKIIHFVREHTRSNGAVVKAHVRGLSRFSWRGYECAVTAPRLRGEVYTAGPMVEPEEIDVVDGKTPKGFLEVDEVARVLADSEDYGYTPERLAA